MSRPNVFNSLVLLASSVLVIALILPGVRTLVRSARMHRAHRQIGTVSSKTVLPAANPGEVQQFDKAHVEVAYGNLRLSFEPNLGQTDPQVKFLSRAGNRTLWLTKDEAVLAVGAALRDSAPRGNPAATVPQNSQSAPAILRMKFVAANPDSTIEGESKQPAVVNYFGGKPSEWLTKMPTYARVRYRSLYPAIDLVFYGSNRELEYDLVVSPGADPRQIRLAIDGAQKIRIDAAGNLVLETSAGDVVQQKPRIYQRSDAGLTKVAGEYVITGRNEVAFRLGGYNHGAAVVIDPVLRYSTFLGGSGIDTGNGIAVDSSNRAVVVGFTCSSNFPVTDGTKPLESGRCASFITKFDFTGSNLVFSTFLGGDETSISAVALDSSDNIYVTGSQSGEFLAFPITPGAFQSKFAGVSDAFVAKLNAGGTKLVYSTFLGGSGDDHAFAIAVDSAGNAHVTGSTSSTDFPSTPGAFQRECKLGEGIEGPVCFNAFVSKLNSNGSRLLYSTFLGGSSDALQEGDAIAVDHEGQAFVTGSTAASDFPTTAGSAQPVLLGGPCTGEFCSVHGFVANLSSSGSHLIYSTFLSGTGFDRGNGIAVDSKANAFVTGLTGSTDFPVKNAFQPVCLSFECAFVTELNSRGRLVYSTFLGGGGHASTGGSWIAVTPGGQAYVTGLTSSRTFPTTETAFQRVFSGTTTDGFITKFNPAGGLVYSSYLGTINAFLTPRVALDRDTNAYVAGTAGPSFLVTPGAFQQQFGESEREAGDAFLSKVVALCALNTANRTVTICSPGNGSKVTSPVRIIAGTTDVTPVKLTQVYLDGKKIYEAQLSAINVGLPVAAGTHRLTVQALDTASVFFKKSITVTVH